MSKSCSNNGISNMDIYRAWYEENEFGVISKELPLESLICSSVVCSSSIKEIRILNANIEHCSSGLSYYNKLFSEDPSSSGCEFVLTPPKFNHLNEKFCGLTTLVEEELDVSDVFKTGLTLANDFEIALLSVTPEQSLLPVPATNKPLSTLISKVPMPEIVNTVSKSAVPIKPPEVDNESDQLAKRFKTAKQEFVKDGGNITSITKKSYSIPNGVSDGKANTGVASAKPGTANNSSSNNDLPVELQQFEKALVERIEADIIESGAHGSTSFDDIAGLQFAKKCVQEVICWPMLRPDLFTGIANVLYCSIMLLNYCRLLVGLRSLPKGVLLFGPPGTLPCCCENMRSCLTCSDVM